MFKIIIEFFKSLTYERTLEDYINSRNPQSEADVERYTLQFHRAYKNWN